MAEFVAELREYNVTPHVAQNTTNRRSTAGRPATPAMRSVDGCASALRRCLAGPKGAGFRRTHHRGLARVGWMFTLTATSYNLICLPKLVAIAA